MAKFDMLEWRRKYVLNESGNQNDVQYLPKSKETMNDFIPVEDALPNNDRTVQVRWDDGSTSPKSLAFFDEKSQIPPTGVRIWWEHPSMRPLPDGIVTAWKDIEKKI